MGRVSAETISSAVRVLDAGACRAFHRPNSTIWRNSLAEAALMFGPMHRVCGGRQMVCEEGDAAASSVRVVKESCGRFTTVWSGGRGVGTCWGSSCPRR